MTVEYARLPMASLDADAIADLHAESWRTAYRGIVADAFLDGPVYDDRRRVWRERVARAPSDRSIVVTATSRGTLVGFACVFLDADAEWGALLDNLHVSPAHRGAGIGGRLLEAARQATALAEPGRRFHLWVLEANLGARRFYDRHGGREVDRTMADVAAGHLAPALRCVWEPAGR